jgi:hypothetical protein
MYDSTVCSMLLLVIITLVIRDDTRIRNALFSSISRIHDIRLFRASTLHHRDISANGPRQLTAIVDTIAFHRRLGQREADSFPLLSHNIHETAGQDLVHLPPTPQRPEILHEPAAAVLTVFDADGVPLGLVLPATTVADVDPIEPVFVARVLSIRSVVGLAELLGVREDAIP